MSEQMKSWDVFISHASEDKDLVARPLAEKLRSLGVRVWFDEFTLRVGDSLSSSIDSGLANSRFGLVILSEQFLSKNWTKRELAGLISRSIESSEKLILPVWHKITKEDVAKFSPPLADILALSTDEGISNLTAKLVEVIKPVDRLLRVRALKIGTYFRAIGRFHPILNHSGAYIYIYRLLFNRLFFFDRLERSYHLELIDSWRLNKSDVRLSYIFYLPKTNILEDGNAIELKLSNWLELEDLPDPYIIPRSCLGDDECFVGTGPYKIADMEQENRLRKGIMKPVILESNNRYFGKMASVESIEFHILNNLVDLRDSLRSRELDLGLNIELEDEEENFEFEYNLDSITFYMILDQEVFNESYFRQAVNFAIDRERLRMAAQQKK